ncbi:hypothetical protein ACOMHN_056347 [Nucella lapillus]
MGDCQCHWRHEVQTNTRQPSPDWSKNDLLRLLSYFEGELQARDITIAALKAEKAKQLLYQAKYGRFGLGDPFVALQRDTIGTRDSNFDEAAVKSMYDNQLAQLENLIATQRKAQLKMREQLANAEKRYHKVCFFCVPGVLYCVPGVMSCVTLVTGVMSCVTGVMSCVTGVLSRVTGVMSRVTGVMSRVPGVLSHVTGVFCVTGVLCYRCPVLQVCCVFQVCCPVLQVCCVFHVCCPVLQVCCCVFQVCSELEEEKRKHAQDTAQGDDVTYMLEKERERLRQEIDFEKSTSKKLEKDLRRTLAALEEERASAARHKQVALLLLKERKHILQKLTASGQSLSQGDYSLPEEMREEDLVEGLEVDPQRSLNLEAALEEQLGKIEAERAAAFPGALEPEPSHSGDLESQVEALQRQVQSMAATSGAESPEAKSGAFHRSLEVHSPASALSGRVSPNAGPGYSQTLAGFGGEGRALGGGSGAVTQGRQGVSKGVVDGGRIGSISPEREVIHRPSEASLRKLQYGAGGGNSPVVVDKQGGAGVSTREAGVVTVGTAGPDSGGSVLTGGKISFHVSSTPGGVIVGGGSAGPSHRTAAATGGPLSAGRGHPPPVPPNKPNILPPGTAGKPAPPPKVAVMGRDRGGMDGKVVQIPVNVVASPTSSTSSSSSSSPSASSQSSRESSPIRKTAQPDPPPPVDLAVPVDVPSNPSQALSSATLEFLGPEMASLQELLAALTTGEASTRDPPSLESSPSPSTPSPTSPISPTSPSFSPSSSSSSLPTSLPAPPAPSSVLRSWSVDVHTSAVHRLAACGDVGALRMLILQHEADVNLPLKDGTTPVHCAVENDREACLQLLLDKGGQSSALRDDRVTPVHMAAALGHLRCLKLLLERGAAVNSFSGAGETALHLAVDEGHLACCQLLLLHGANVTLPRHEGLTAVHCAVWRDQPDVLRCLLERLPSGGSPPACLLSPLTPPPSTITPTPPTSSLIHLAAQLPSEKCLRLLVEHLPVTVSGDNTHGRSIIAVASPACRDFLSHLGEQCGADLNLTVELKTQLEGATVSVTRIGNMALAAASSWQQLEEQLRAVLSLFLSHLDQGLRTRRLIRMEGEGGGGHEGHFTLGITMSHISTFEMGFYRWTPGMQTEKLPYNMASNNTEKKVAIIFDDTDNFCELIAFDILHPVSVLQDYLRLLDQYKSVVFHGPVNSGKSYLVQRLAHCLAVRQKGQGGKPAVLQLKLSSKTSHGDLLSFLQNKGCLVPVGQVSAVTPILILDNLEKVNMADLFGPLLDPLAQRGRQHAFCLPSDQVNGSGQKFYFPENFCILATLNRSRSTGIELHVQQRFRWVHFRHDAEPLRNLLARHFLRRLYHLGNGCLPSGDDPLLRATEWIICIWHRLNDSLGKLGLPDLVFGPCCFFRCPLEKKTPQLILQWVQELWVQELWNAVVAPQVREAVRRSTKGGGGQHKVANTALYVLMQRAIVLACPLSLKEKETYLQGFSGSNELDLPFKADRGEGGRAVSQLTGRHIKTVHHPEADRDTGSYSPLPSPATPVSASARSHGRQGANAPTPSKYREEQRGRSVELFAGSKIKRRSLSESSMSKTARRLEQEEEEDRRGQQSPGNPSSLLAAPPSPTMPSSFKTSPSPGGAGSGIGGREGGGRSGRVSPLLLHTPGRLSSSHHHPHHPHQHNKKSRSSENISPSGLYSSSKALFPNPFSFSLSTPKSSLVSFKFFDKSSAAASELSVLSPSAVTSVTSGVTSVSVADSGGSSSSSSSNSSGSGSGGHADSSSAQTSASHTGGSTVTDTADCDGPEASGSV